MSVHLAALLAVVLAFAHASAYAAPPQTLDYQGYLADSSGVPLTGTSSLSISLYTAASGGSALWTQMSSPSLSNGRFNVVLDGSGANPFPAGLFDQQLYVGLTVSGDPEMTPRQPLTSVPSAFEAINSASVNGMQANEIIDAASDEVRTPISSLPFTISQPGSYYFTQNLKGSGGSVSGGLINVATDHVAIDLMGFMLDCNGVNGDGINFDNRTAVVVKNGTVRGCGLAGISGTGSGGSHAVFDMQLVDNGSGGTTQFYSGLWLVSQDNRVERVIAKGNGGSGILVGTSGVIKDCSASDSGGSYGIYGGNGSVLLGNTARNNQGLAGIAASQGALVSNNAAYFNQGDGIRTDNGATLTNNVANGNALWGINAGSANTVMGNTLVSNNNTSVDSYGGLRISNDSLVKNNTADGNRHTGIFIEGFDNVLKDNHVTDTFNINGAGTADGFCYSFNSVDNAAVGNTATGCTTEFAGALPPASRFVDNIGW